MRILKKILLTLLVIIVLMVIIAFFLPSEMRVERSLTINASSEAIFAQVNDYKNWEKWSPWHQKDPNMKIFYESQTAGAGASYRWESEEVGNGMQKITSSVPNDSIVSEMYFMESKDPAYGKFYFSPSDSGTTVKWVMHMDNGMNPISRWMSVLMKGMIADDFDEGLKNLEKLAESAPAAPAAQEPKIELGNTNDMTVATVKDSCPVEQITEKLGSMLGTVLSEMNKNGSKQAAPVFAIYHSFSHEKVVFEAGIPVDKPFKPAPKSPVNVWEMKGTGVVLAHHYGSYRSTEQTHYKIDDWVKKNNKTIVGPPVEVYVSDPTKEPDTTKWYTQIYYPVQ